MGTLREELAADMAEAIEDYEQTFEWMGETIPCVRRDEPTASDLLEDGGYVEGINYFLVVAKAAFANGIYPADGDMINHDDGQIKKIKGDADIAAVQLVLTIGSPDQ